MKNKRILKALGLIGTLVLCLLLTGCVVPPDDIDAASGYTVGTNDNFQNITPPTRKITEAPATDTPKPAASPTYSYNWGGNTATQPSATIDTGSISLPTISAGAPVTIVTPPISITTNAPASGTSETLKNGSTGDAVRKMQSKLKELGYYKGSVDGDFGDGTETAVKAFQKQNGLTADGKAGTKTLTLLYSGNAKKAPSTVTTPRVTATPRPTATPDLSRDYYLELGSSGSKVRTLQNRLIELGWMDGKADGEFEGATEYAVIAFQKRYSSLYDDGVAGPSTLKILYGNGAATSKTPVSSIGETLEAGDKGDAVKAMQTRLKSLGFLSGKADGDFGDATKAAVIAFQTANNLKADGRAGTSTLNKLYSSDAKDADSLKPDNTEDTRPEDEEDEDADEEVIINGYVVLKEGSRRDEVKELQRALKNRGYFSNSITGYYGEATKAAVMAFQQQNGLKADGVAGPATQNKLFNTTSSSGYETLEYGDNSTAVKNMQYVLKELGYFDGSANGYYGSTTRDAVREFQIRNDLTPVDGVAGNKTLQRLYSNKAIAASAPTTKFDTLKKGDTGDMVVQLQEQLAVLGYLSEPTARFDSATEEAVKNFQRRNNLKVDGEAGDETLQLLFKGNPKPAY